MEVINPGVITGVPLVVGSLLTLVIGILFCFFGYRLIKVILGIAGFVLGFGLVGGLVLRFTGSALAAILSGLAGGILFAVLAVLLYFVGVFILGAYLGAVLGALLATVLGIFTPLWVFIVLAAAGGILAVIFQRFMVILATSFIGAYTIMLGVVYLIPMGPASPWVLFAGWVALGIAGLFVQYKVTGKKKLAEERRKREAE